jgi:hypothetical protein
MGFKEKGSRIITKDKERRKLIRILFSKNVTILIHMFGLLKKGIFPIRILDDSMKY